MFTALVAGFKAWLALSLAAVPMPVWLDCAVGEAGFFSPGLSDFWNPGGICSTASLMFCLPSRPGTNTIS